MIKEQGDKERPPTKNEHLQRRNFKEIEKEDLLNKQKKEETNQTQNQNILINIPQNRNPFLLPPRADGKDAFIFNLAEIFVNNILGVKTKGEIFNYMEASSKGMKSVSSEVNQSKIDFKNKSLEENQKLKSEIATKYNENVFFEKDIKEKENAIQNYASSLGNLYNVLADQRIKNAHLIDNLK